MAGKEKQGKAKQAEPAEFKIKYIGTAAETTVLDFPNGRGHFKRGSSYPFYEQEEIEAAKRLIKTNRNFEEVKS